MRTLVFARRRAVGVLLRHLAGVLTATVLLGVFMSLSAESKKPGEPIVIGHRGASGHRPEHTLEAYWLAIQDGADFVEPDLVPTKDGVLVARHENDISGTTDVANHPEFANRRFTKMIDGNPVTGWFTEDFTLAELKTLRAKERPPQQRGTHFDGLFSVPTLQEVIDLVRAYNLSQNNSSKKKNKAFQNIGIYPETKHPSYFDSIGLSLEEKLVQVLNANGYVAQTDPVFVQSFETSNLKELSRLTRVRLVQLLDASGRPYDFVLKNDPRTYADLAKPQGLAEIATYASGVGVNKNLIFPRDAQARLLAPTTLIHDAHALGLIVHGWTFRAENSFLPIDFRVGSNPNLLGDMASEVEAFLGQGMDGFFTDFPGIGNAARDALVEEK